MVATPHLEALRRRLLADRQLFDHPDSYAAGVLDTLDAVLGRVGDHEPVVHLRDEWTVAAAG